MSSLLNRLQSAVASAKRDVRVWGIDLGTTNSTITELKNDLVPRPLEIEQKTEQGAYTGPIVPSIVAVRQDSFWVGEGAKRMRNGSATVRGVEGKTLFSESKNDMGLRKTYTDAPSQLKHARDVARTVLRFLRDDASEQTGGTPDQVVITVPASFLANQRQDTLKAAEAAGMPLAEHCLLDEPTAALLDYAMTADLEISEGDTLRILLFDFGGGTCDISIVELTNPGEIRGRVCATSRYHRLGGGDIDRAIVHEVLIPTLIQENGIDRTSLTWTEKKRLLEPQLLGTAEQLKTALCGDILRRAGFGKYEDADKTKVFARQPRVGIKLKRQEFTIASPQLDANQFDDLLTPFLSKDQLSFFETEYRATQSIFSPITDALMRAGLEPQEVDLLLLAGGSSMIPQVQWALQAHFRNAKVHTYRTAEEAQLAISRGAAWHAMGIEVLGEPLIRPCASDGISLQTGSGFRKLVPVGSTMPYPAEGWAECLDLTVPESQAERILMNVVTERDKRSLYTEVWKLDRPAALGDGLLVRYKLTGNGEFVMKAALTDDPTQVFSRTIENPLVQTHNPNLIRVKIEEAEEALKKAALGPEDVNALMDIASWYSQLGHNERALDYLNKAQVLHGSIHPGILNRQGMVYAAMGDIDRAVEMYERCYQLGGWNIAKTNASIDLWKGGRYEKAIEHADVVLDDSYSGGPASIVKWRCLRRLKRSAEAAEMVDNIRDAFEPLSDLDDWQLSWYEGFANDTGDGALKAEIKEQRRSLKGNTSAKAGTGAKPPAVGL